MSMGQGNTTTTQKSEAPAYLSPWLGQAAGQATNVLNQGALTPNRGATTLQAQDLIKQRALGGSPLTGAGQGFIEAGLSRPATATYGGMGENPYAQGPNMFGSGSNPYLDATFNKAALATQNQLSSEFARSGRNVGAAQGLRAQQLNDLATNIYGGDYGNERNRQLQYQGQLTGIGAQGIENERNRRMQSGESAADRQQSLLGYGLPYANQGYNDLQQLASVGGAEDAYANQAQGAYGQQVDDYIRRLSQLAGTGGGTVSINSPSNRNPLAGAAGGALTGSAFGLPGIIGGGLLGGIFG